MLAVLGPGPGLMALITIITVAPQTTEGRARGLRCCGDPAAAATTKGAMR